MDKLTSWGQYPYVHADVKTPSKEELPVLEFKSYIPRGLGRSYGDSALASAVVTSKKLKHFIAFDKDKGLLTCDAGVSLDEILRIFVPQGWFLQVTPGTKFVSVGGAIASDVHGKNHHIDGCFSEFVQSITLVINNQEVQCSREVNSELFYATCGGMGLTGMIVNATIQLRKVKSAYIKQKTIKTNNLKDTLAVFEEHQSSTYSVAWIDCLSDGAEFGRSLVMLGEHAEQGSLEVHQSGKLTIPCNLPSQLLNKYSIQSFNFLYYHRIRNRETNDFLHYDPFFYPLDGINNWNRMYGKNGFTQYQFVIPKEAGYEGLSEILKAIVSSKQGSFLAVLKIFGKENNSPLSFPMEGFTLALDFKISDSLFPFLNKLDDIVKKYKGRLYLAKDARMSESTFKTGYPRWEQFQKVRDNYGTLESYNSLQSKRIGL